MKMMIDLNFSLVLIKQVCLFHFNVLSEDSSNCLIRWIDVPISISLIKNKFRHILVMLSLNKCIITLLLLDIDNLINNNTRLYETVQYAQI